METTGVLKGAQLVQNIRGAYLTGTVSHDNKKRFPDGVRVSTSYLTGLEVHDGQLVAFTMNSSYLIDGKLTVAQRNPQHVEV